MSFSDGPNQIVFQAWQGENGVFISLAQWERLKTIQEAVDTARTWGEFQEALPEGEWESLGLIVDPDYDFEVDALPGYWDPGYPDWVGHAMARDLPDEFLNEYGIPAVAMFNGAWLEFPERRLPEMEADLQALGFEVVEVVPWG
jgi:hypothetical protein